MVVLGEPKNGRGQIILKTEGVSMLQIFEDIHLKSRPFSFFPFSLRKTLFFETGGSSLCFSTMRGFFEGFFCTTLQFSMFEFEKYESFKKPLAFYCHLHFNEALSFLSLKRCADLRRSRLVNYSSFECRQFYKV